VSGSGISWAICKSAPRSRQITMPAPHHSIFYRLDALPDDQTGFTFLVPAHPGSPGQRAVNRVCVTENSICLVVVSFVVVFITAACEDTHNPRSTWSPAVLTISHCLRVLLTGVRPAVTQSPCSNSLSYRKKNCHCLASSVGHGCYHITQELQ